MSPPDETPELRLDLRDVKPEQCKGFDTVIHLGALSNDPLGDLDRDRCTTSTCTPR